MNSGKYDNEKRTKAVNALVLRLAVAAYMGYLCYKLWAGDRSDSNVWIFRIIGGFFFAAALVFVVYSVNRLRIDLKDAGTDDAEENSDHDA